VIDGGRLVEEGTHASLIDAGGVYSRLVGLQLTSTEGAVLRLKSGPRAQPPLKQERLVLHKWFLPRLTLSPKPGCA
jgi:hypothetical protein